MNENCTISMQLIINENFKYFKFSPRNCSIFVSRQVYDVYNLWSIKFLGFLLSYKSPVECEHFFLLEKTKSRNTECAINLRCFKTKTICSVFSVPWRRNVWVGNRIGKWYEGVENYCFQSKISSGFVSVKYVCALHAMDFIDMI